MGSRFSPELSALLKDVRRQKLDRRSFLQGAAALGLTLPAAQSFWSSTVRAAPTKGGAFRVGLDDGNTTDSMDPATYNSRFMITMAHTHRNFLTEITPDNDVAGELAESLGCLAGCQDLDVQAAQGCRVPQRQDFRRQ